MPILGPNPIPPAPYPPTTETPPFGELLQELIDYLTSRELQANVLVLKIIFIAVAVIFAATAIYFLLSTEYLEWHLMRSVKNFLSPRAAKGKKLLKKWNKIQKNLAKAKLEPQIKLALLEGLDVFGKTLSKLGYSGETLLERIGKLSEEDVSEFAQLSDIIKLCENVARDPDYRLSKEQASNVLGVFEKTLRDLQVF